MNDVKLVARVMREIEIILSDHVEPDHVQDPEGAVKQNIRGHGPARSSGCRAETARRESAVEVGVKGKRMTHLSPEWLWGIAIIAFGIVLAYGMSRRRPKNAQRAADEATKRNFDKK